jgi:hypothetical protein
MISHVNQPLSFSDAYTPQVVSGGVRNPLYSLLEADARRDPFRVHPIRRQCYRAFLKHLYESGAVEYTDPADLYRKRGLSHAVSNRLANAMEVMTENVFRISEGVVKPWIIQQSAMGGINEDTLTTNVASFTRTSMGLVSSVFPKSIIPELFQVQTISQPSAYIFYKTYIRKTSANAGEDISDPDYKTSTYASLQAAADTETLTTYVKEVGTSITQETVEAKLRKLKWSASLESVFTLQAYHGMSMEALNDDAIRTELALEVDQEVINAVVDHAGIFSHTWDPTDGGSYSSYSPSEKAAHDATLFDALIDAQTSISAARIVDRSKIWVAGSPSSVGRLRKVGEKFFSPTTGNDGDISRGSLAGTLIGRNRVYEIPWMADNVFLCGYLSDDFADAGFIFAPFLPFFLGPVQWDDSMNFVVKKGGLTWYATKMAVPQMYAKVTITSS